MNIFRSKTKSPQDMVKSLKEALSGLENPKKSSEKATEEVSKSLATMRAFLYPQGETGPPQQSYAMLAQEVYHHDIFTLLINNLSKLEFEARKDAVQVFNNLLRRQVGTRSPTVEHLCGMKDSIFKTLILGYEDAEIALSCGLMLREAIKYEALAKVLLHSEHFENFFKYVELPMFDIASDATLTFKLLLTKHKVLCATFLEEKYDWFMDRYGALLNSDNYVTQRQSLKLLGELLLDRANFNVMTKYISNPDNLKLMMTMLRNDSRNIQFEAFHVFKVFVANPSKPAKIKAILIKNKERLTKFLSHFQCDRSDDEQFNDEKAYLIKQVQDLK